MPTPNNDASAHDDDIENDDVITEAENDTDHDEFDEGDSDADANEFDGEDDWDEDTEEDPDGDNPDNLSLDFDAPDEDFSDYDLDEDSDDDLDDELDDELDEDPDEFDDVEDDEFEDDEFEDDDDSSPEQLKRENEIYRERIATLEEASMGAVEEAMADILGDLANDLGLPEDDDLDADTLSTAIRDQLDKSRNETLAAKRDLAIFRAAVPANADVDRLMDSKRFTETINQIDATAPNYSDQVAFAVATALETNPEFKAPTPIDRMGGDFSGGIDPTPTGPETVESLANKRRKRRGF